MIVLRALILVAMAVLVVALSIRRGCRLKMGERKVRFDKER